MLRFLNTFILAHGGAQAVRVLVAVESAAAFTGTDPSSVSDVVRDGVLEEKSDSPERKPEQFPLRETRAVHDTTERKPEESPRRDEMCSEEKKSCGSGDGTEAVGPQPVPPPALAPPRMQRSKSAPTSCQPCHFDRHRRPSADAGYDSINLLDSLMRRQWFETIILDCYFQS
jgi:hypothetical protein